MADFDAEAARKAGYSDTEIADFLGQSIDVAGARKAGYKDHEIISHATGRDFAPAAPAPKVDKPLADENGIPITLDPTARKGALDPTRGQTFTENAMAGAGKALTDMGRGATQLAGKFLTGNPLYNAILPQGIRDQVAGNQANIDAAQKTDAPLMKTGGGLTGEVGGTVASALLPGGALKGAGTVLGKLPGAADAARALMAAGRAMNAPTTVKGIAGTGAAMGAAQPVTTEEGELGRLKNAGIGAAAGTVGTLGPRLVAKAASGIKSAIEPFYAGGKDLIQGRLLNKLAGAEAPAVAADLRAAGAPAVGPFQPGMEKSVAGEFVPGSVPTVGQVAANRAPSISALERTAVAIDPVNTNAHAARLGTQNEARLGQLERMSGTDGARDFHDAARNAAADKMYGKAFQSGITPARAAKYQGEIAGILENPAIQDALPVARRLAKFDGLDLADPSGSLQGLHYVKKALDDMLDKAAQTGIGKIEAAKIGETKQALLGLMDRLSPAYGAARAEFQAASRPINQMDIAEALRQKATNNLTGNMKPQMFANNLNDATAARATGFKGATLENTLEPQQLGMLNNILEDLRRARAGQDAGRGVGSDTVQKLAYSNIANQAGIPNFIREFAPAQAAGNFGTRLMDTLYGRQNREMAGQVAEMMMDPGLAGSLMEKAARAQQPGRTGRALSPFVSQLPRAAAAGALVPDMQQ